MEATVTELLVQSDEGEVVVVTASMLKQDLKDRKPPPNKPNDDIKYAPKRWAGQDGKFTRLIRTQRSIDNDAVALVRIAVSSPPPVC